MSRRIMKGDSAGLPVAKKGTSGSVRGTGYRNSFELGKVYDKVTIMSPVVGPKTDSARISAAVDTVMEKGTQSKK